VPAGGLLRRGRRWARVLAAAASLAGAACGKSTLPSPPGRIVLIDGETFVVRASSAGATVLGQPPAGRVDVTVSWHGRFNPIDVYVTPSGCPSFRDVAGGACAVIAREEGSARPKSVAFDTEAAESYTVWTANRGASAEAVTLDAVVTTAPE
jgi:hypothetical protein